MAESVRAVGWCGHHHRPDRAGTRLPVVVRDPKGDPMERLLLELLIRLEAVGDRDESLFDTVVRQKMGNAVFFGFIKPRRGFVLPDDYGMPDEENRAVKAALGAYIEGARALAPSAGLDTFHKRLAAFQNLAVRTAGQKNDYDDFFGWSDPKLFDEVGNVRQPS